MYVFTGEDCTSAFKGKGKVGRPTPEMPKFHSTFSQLGSIWKVSDESTAKLEAYTCAMYGYPRETEINVVRLKMLKKMVGEDETLSTKSKVDLSKLPPCRDSLIPHIQRVNYRLAQFKNACIAIDDQPEPFEHENGWSKNERGDIEPVWSMGEVFPTSLVDVMERIDSCDSDDEELSDIDYEFESDEDD